MCRVFSVKNVEMNEVWPEGSLWRLCVRMCLYFTGFHLNSPHTTPPHPGPARSAPLIAFQIRPELHSSVCVCVRACALPQRDRQTRSAHNGSSVDSWIWRDSFRLSHWRFPFIWILQPQLCASQADLGSFSSDFKDVFLMDWWIWHYGSLSVGMYHLSRVDLCVFRVEYRGL